jgi:hypothetical protein
MKPDHRGLPSSVYLELETDLRLHTHYPELGKAELLTDAITLPFIDLEKRLDQHRTRRSATEAEKLRHGIKAYLSRLNANPLLPLQFRLKVLQRLEHELDLFDSHTTAAVLNAYKIAVEMLQKAARTKPEYYLDLLNVVATAIELAVKLLRHDLESYQPPAIITIRQTFSLARLGLGVLPALPEGLGDASSRLQRAVSLHELVRALNFFRRPVTEQRKIWSLLEEHANVLRPSLCPRRKPLPSLSGKAFLVSRLSHPNEAPKMTSRLPEIFSSDSIVIPMDAFLRRLTHGVRKAKHLLDNPELQKTDMHTDEKLQLIIMGSHAILDDLSIKKRARRYRYRETRVYLEWNLQREFAEMRNAMSPSSYAFAPFEWSVEDAWWITDISKTGVGLERTSSRKMENIIGAMVALRWPQHKGEPKLGFIRWFKEPKVGEQRLGIEFLRGNYRPLKASLIGSDIGIMQDVPSWYVVAEQAADSLRVFSPEKDIFAGMVLNLSDSDQEHLYKVTHVIQTGPNYAFFLADRLREKPEIVRQQTS